MGIKVALTMLPYSNHVYTPPIQLAYLKGYLQQDKDTEVKVLDSEVHYYQSSLINRSAQLYWEKTWGCDRDPVTDIDAENRLLLDEVVNMIIAERPDVAGFSVTSQNLLFTRYVSMQIKKINSKIYIIYGGLLFGRRKKWLYQNVDMHREFYEVDCIVNKEGEATLLEIVRSLKAGKIPTHCSGATIRLGEQIIDGGERPLIKDLDSIPFPDFSDFKRKDYISDYIRILFWRGCIGQCVYCTENYTMGTIRYRSPKNIIDEIKLRLAQGYKRFQTCDLSLNPGVSRLAEVCRLIIKEGLNIEFVFGQFRHSPDLKPEIFRLLRSAGFEAVAFGTETGSQIILDKMRKGVSVDIIERNIRDAHKEGLKVILFFMAGFPGETEDTFLKTLNLVERNRDYIDALGHVNPTALPMSTHFHDNLNEYGLDIKTLFKFPDTWQSLDGRNNYEWRRSLSDRLLQHFIELGIPFVDYRKDANPRITL